MTENITYRLSDVGVWHYDLVKEFVEGVDNVLTIHPYNDLGLLARGKLIVLAEAQALCQA